MRFGCLRAGGIVALLGSGGPAAAVDAAAVADAEAKGAAGADGGANVTEEITVIGDPRGTSLDPGSVLEGAELRKRVGSTLGETLERELGVHNATFGPGVGLPVIRGMSGARVQLLQGGIGTHDASSVSPDHAVTIEALLAEEIEVRRGPGTLRYGGSAMGGAVDVKMGRIPEKRPDGHVDGSVEGRYDSNPDLWAGVFTVDVGAGPVVVHADGYHRSSDDIQIPGNALDEAAVREQFGNIVEFDNTDGYIANSDTTASGLSLGTSLVFERGFVGVAVNKLDKRYGIPPGGLPPHSDDPANAPPTPENLRIDMAQTRWDVAAEIEDPLPYVESLSFRAGNVDYEHFELARGLPSTHFESLATEARVELEHQFSESWQGTVGYQWSRQQFGATGVESFIPTADILRNASYVIQSFRHGDVAFEFALRRESSTISPLEESRTVAGLVLDLPANFDHDARSASGAVDLTLTKHTSLRFGFTRSERTPAIQEVLSLGPHFATRSFAIGNYLLEVESASNLDVSFAYRGNRVDLDVAVYRNQIDDYIYQENQGFFYDIETRFFQLACVQLTDCVPVFSYFQQDAVFVGYEAELRYQPPDLLGVASEVMLFSDYVRGYFKAEGAGNVPRLPPRRAGVLAIATWRDFGAEARWTRGFPQERAGLNETLTAGYDRVDLEVSYSGDVGFGDGILAFVKGKNITNAEIRHSTSFLRSFAPEPGRSVEAGIRWSF